MNCEDVPMSEWDKLTGAEKEALEVAYGTTKVEFVNGSVRARRHISFWGKVLARSPESAPQKWDITDEEPLA